MQRSLENNMIFRGPHMKYTAAALRELLYSMIRRMGHQDKCRNQDDHPALQHSGASAKAQTVCSVRLDIPRSVETGGAYKPWLRI